jgi:hypothetical protein
MFIFWWPVFYGKAAVAEQGIFPEVEGQIVVGGHKSRRLATP